MRNLFKKLKSKTVYNVSVNVESIAHQNRIENQNRNWSEQATFNFV